MDRKIDSYTVSQTALALGVSTKRIRQLIESGRLKRIGENPVQVSQLEVLELKAEREKSKVVTKTRQGREHAQASSIADQLSKIVETINENNRRAIETMERAEALNRQAYTERIHLLEAELKELKARKWWQSKGA